MAFISMNVQKLKSNFDYLDSLFQQRNIQWAVVTKLLCGNRDFIAELLKFNIRQVCDSRVSNLQMIKELNPAVETIYIKPAAVQAIEGVVKYADISMNTEYETIRLLSKEAKKQGKIHKVIIMIEMGELREGIMRDNLMDFYNRVFGLSNIEVVGIGTNLSCLYGVLPNHDKLIQLSLYEQLIEAKFNHKIDYVSGGTSVTIPLLFDNLLPAGVNHFRVGETLFLGTDVYHDRPLQYLERDVFTLYAQIIELYEKPMVPDGNMGTNMEGKVFSFDDTPQRGTAFRAIVDIGLLDVDETHIFPSDKDCTIVGKSSDMFVIDLIENNKGYKVGDMIEFTMDYMGTLRILHSRYIEKRLLVQ